MNNEMSYEAQYETNTNKIIEYAHSDPREFTYVGVGTAGCELTDQRDQILPKKFLIDDVINNTHKTIRIIHFDSRFTLEWLNDYFKSNRWTVKTPLEFVYDFSEGLHIWRTTDFRIEIIFVFSYFNLSNDHPFLFELIKATLSYHNMLVFQPFIGLQCNDISKFYFKRFGNSNEFRNRILFDISYDNQCGCFTDMVKYAPEYDKDGNFYNYTLINEGEMIGLIDSPDCNARISQLIKTHFVKKYKKIINDIHVNYRRKVRGLEDEMYDDPEFGYTKGTPADEIMAILQGNIRPIIPILDRLKILNEKSAELPKLLGDYKSYDLYSWLGKALNVVDNVVESV
jgi:hypothetical protein